MAERAQYTHEEQSAIREALTTGEQPLCPRCEVVMTAMFLIVIMGATDKRAPAGLAPIAIGLCLTLIHLQFSRSSEDERSAVA